MGKTYQNTIKYTKWAKNKPNGSKIDQMAKLHTIFYCRTLENVPKLGFWV
jgi:hypothetical protein